MRPSTKGSGVSDLSIEINKIFWETGFQFILLFTAIYLWFEINTSNGCYISLNSLVNILSRGQWFYGWKVCRIDYSDCTTDVASHLFNLQSLNSLFIIMGSGLGFNPLFINIHLWTQGGCGGGICWQWTTCTLLKIHLFSGNYLERVHQLINCRELD